MEYKEETKTVRTLLLKDEEIDALLNFIGNTSGGDRMELGLDIYQSDILGRIYHYVVDTTRGIKP